MKEVKVKDGIVKTRGKNPLTLLEIAGYLELAAGVAAIMIEQQLLGGILIGVGSTHIVGNMIRHAK